MAKQWDTPPAMTIETGKAYQVKLETTRGDITLELYAEHAPKTVNNFIFLINEGFYNGVTFHRVIENFMIQGGDPTGTGRGGPGYRFEYELVGNPLKHGTKVISMANAGPNTNGSQWYITLGDASQLDGSYTIFGRVIEGMDVVEAITPRNPENDPNASPGDVISTITIEVAGN